MGLAWPGRLVAAASSKFRFRHQCDGGSAGTGSRRPPGQPGVSSVRVRSHQTFPSTHTEPGAAYQVASLLNKHLPKSVPAA